VNRAFEKNVKQKRSPDSLQESKRTNNMAASTYLSVLAAVVALMVGAVYLFGVPPQWKRAMEEKALETMGENKASYLVKGMHNLVSRCFIHSANTAFSFQDKSTTFLHRTRRTSTRSSQESATSLEEHSRIPSAKRQGKWETLSLVP
jgi:hypothetical protein